MDQSDASLDYLAVLEEDIFSNSDLASTLRKCLILGGRAGSADLRDWATRELQGFDNVEEVPDYRRAAAPIMIDANLGNRRVTGQTISPSVIPEFAREIYAEPVIFGQGIAELEALVEETRGGETTHMSHARAMDICATIDKESGNLFQQTTALYWSISHSVLVGIVDAVRTRLAQVVAEMRVHTPVGQTVPTAEVAGEAVRRFIEEGARTSRG